MVYCQISIVSTLPSVTVDFFARNIFRMFNELVVFACINTVFQEKEKDKEKKKDRQEDRDKRSSEKDSEKNEKKHSEETEKVKDKSESMDIDLEVKTVPKPDVVPDIPEMVKKEIVDVPVKKELDVDAELESIVTGTTKVDVDLANKKVLSTLEQHMYKKVLSTLEQHLY